MPVESIVRWRIDSRVAREASFREVSYIGSAIPGYPHLFEDVTEIRANIRAGRELTGSYSEGALRHVDT